MKGNNYISDSKKAARVKTKKKKSRLAQVSRKQSQSLVQIMNGDFLTKGFVLINLSYIFFVIFLMILMVSKGYYVHSLANDISKAEKEVGDITADYVETKAKLEELTRRTQMIEKLAPYGLKETINPTKVIHVKKEEK